MCVIAHQYKVLYGQILLLIEIIMQYCLLETKTKV